jgi:hypothetical protein
VRTLLAVFLLSGVCLFLFPSSSWSDDAVAGHSILSGDEAIIPLKNTQPGQANVLAVPGDFGGNDGTSEQVQSALDGDLTTKYFNKGGADGGNNGLNTGFVVQCDHGAAVVTGIQFATANDLPERDPIRISIEGSNSPDALTAGCSDFKSIYQGTSGLEKTTDRGTWGGTISFPNTTAYKYYRVLVMDVRDSSIGATQYSEVRLFGVVQ